MKTSELCRLLRERGCYLSVHGKKHDRWFSPITGALFSVPRHGAKEIPPKTLSSIKEQAGI
ncbi:MAG: type II toxin-antitoxin system HicA family toxin [Bacteroidales bacterium]|nr:type II toxin-antitoxin system HicA family toxin [Bacteroidales bacterium]